VATTTRLEWGLAAALLVAHAALFGAIFHWDMVSDLQVHVRITEVGLQNGVWWGAPLPFVTAALVALGRVGWLDEATTLVSAVAVLAKFLISTKIAERELGRRPDAGLLVLIALLSFAFSLPANSMYIGQLPPNLFHNDTVVYLMPFALLLFWWSAQFLRTADDRSIVAAAIGGVVNVAAKPSFVFPFLVVFPLLALKRFKLSAATWKAAGACAATVAALLVQYVYIYKSGATEKVYKYAGFGGDPTSHVRIDPFHVWSHFSPNIPLSILVSIVFPLVAFAIYRRELWSYDLFRYAAALMGVSLVIFALLKETGVREFQGNFAWQAMVCNYILFLVILVRLWSVGAFERLTKRSGVVVGAFGAHVVAGAVFLTYYLANGRYF